MTAPRRATYSDVGQATRLSFQRAIAAGASPPEMLILAAVHYWLTTYSRLSDRRSLAQLARTAGLTTDEEPPHWLTQKVGRRLQALAVYGAIRYEAATGRGKPSFIGLPIDAAEKGAPTAPLPTSEKGAPTAPLPGSADREKGAHGARKREPTARVKGSPVGSPREEILRGDFRGGISSTRDNDNGVSHDRRSAPSSNAANNGTSPDSDDDEPEWHRRLSELLMSPEGAPDDIDTFNHDLEAVTVIEHLRDHLPNPVLDDVIRALEEDPPAQPRLAMRTARAITKEWNIDLPRITFKKISATDTH